MEQKPATALVEGYDPGVDIHTGLYEAALDPAFPIWLVFADREPQFDVIANAHYGVRLWLSWFETVVVISVLRASQ